MPPPHRQLHRCAAPALLGGNGQPSRQMATRTIYYLPKIHHPSTSETSDNYNATCIASEEPSHVTAVHIVAREEHDSTDSDEGAAEHVILCGAPPTAPHHASTAMQNREGGGVAHMLKRYLRPYEEEDYVAVLAKATAAAAAADEAATAALLQGGLDGAAAFTRKHERKNAAKVDTDVWQGRGDTEGTSPRPDVDDKGPGSGRTAMAENRRDYNASEYAGYTSRRHCLPALKRRRWESAPTPASCAAAAAAFGFQGRGIAVVAEKKGVAVAVQSRPQDSSTVESTCPSPSTLLLSSPASTRRSEASAPMSSAWATRCRGGGDSDYEGDASFWGSTTSTSTAAVYNDTPEEDGRGGPLQGALAEFESHAAVSISGPQLAIPTHLSIQQSDDGGGSGEVLRDRSLTTVPLSSRRQLTVALAHRRSNKITSLTNFYLEPRHRRHAQYMAFRDLPQATWTIASPSSCTSSSAFLQLFLARPSLRAVACEVKCSTASRMTNDEGGVVSRIWSIITKYCAAHQPQQQQAHPRSSL
ncbi:hypothetical protein Q4I32_001360 [Leishmania shawi]|uniref:Uncharacterized protein n=1 Tax=Leishmania shawi TaxID=5680 RepID=A0AAW3C9A1_9TRYP